MKKLILVLIAMFICGNVYASKVITVTLTDEEYDAMSVMTVTPEAWAQHAVSNKARKMVNELVSIYSDKQPNKISNTEKKNIIKGIDLEKERQNRKGK